VIEREKISQIVEGYDKDSIRIGALGSHSALDICRGAKDEGFQTLVICQRGRERPYSHYYRTKGIFKEERGIVDEVIVLEAFSEMLRPEIQNELRKRATIFIPHRSFTVYVPYDGIENELRLPIFGSRNLLRAEERDSTKNQYYLLRKAGIRIPAMFKSHEEIDRLVIVKVPEAQRRYERSFFYASTPKEFEQVSKEMLKRGAITESDLESATIEEFIVGAQFNFNYFYSPLLGELERWGSIREDRPIWRGC
jgi:5-formaminoimidazole-4-carboxamide-1-(beta)-D-ribofuranosyl 5'-monophosphate synthetase